VAQKDREGPCWRVKVKVFVWCPRKTSEGVADEARPPKLEAQGHGWMQA